MLKTRPLLGLATTMLPLKLPSASRAAWRMIGSSPAALSPAPGSPKELTCQGFVATGLARWVLRRVAVVRCMVDFAVEVLARVAGGMLALAASAFGTSPKTE